MLAPFPPITSEQVAQRYPGQPRLGERVAALTAWLDQGRAVAAVAADCAIPLSTLYWLRKTWETRGMVGLLEPAGRRPLEPDPALLAPLLKALAVQTSLALGCLPEAAALLPDVLDPAERGRRLAAALTAAIQLRDQALAAELGGNHLLFLRYVSGISVASLARQLQFSPGHLWRILRRSHAALAGELAVALRQAPAHAWEAYQRPAGLVGRDDELAWINEHLRNQRAAQLVGLGGVGKSSLGAELASRWHAAGWQVLWVELAALPDDSEEMLLSDLYRQLAAFGAVQRRQSDPQESAESQRRQLNDALRCFPTLLILDDIHVLRRYPRAAATLVALAQPGPSLAVLAIGRLPAPWPGPLCKLAGLDEALAQAFFVASGGDLALWADVYRQTAGNPKLLQLASAADGQLAATHIDQLLVVSIQRLAPEECGLLAWLFWWSGPLDRSHPFARAAAAPSHWQRLFDIHLLSEHHGLVTLHDLVRAHLPRLIPPAIWERARQAVATYAERHADYALGYRVAQSSRDHAAQYAISLRAAQSAEDQQDTALAAYWWFCRHTLAAIIDDRGGGIEAALRCAWQLFAQERFSEVLALLGPLDPPAGSREDWWRHILLAMTALNLGQRAELEVLLQTPALTAPPPADLPSAERWFGAFQLLMIRWHTGEHWQVCRAVERLGPPDPSQRQHLQDYRFLKALIDLERSSYAPYLALRKRRWRQARRSEPLATLCAEQQEYAVTLHICERYRQAWRLLCANERQLEGLPDGLRWRNAYYACWTSATLGNFAAMAQAVARVARYSSSDDHWHMASRDLTSGVLALQLGQVERAAILLGQATAVYAQHSLYSSWVLSACWEARALLALQRPDAAEERLASALHALRRHHIWRRLALLKDVAHRLSAQQGDLELAVHRARRLAGWCAQIGQPIASAEARIHWAAYLLRQGRPAAAWTVARPALDVFVRLPAGFLAAPFGWHVGAAVCTAQGDLAQAQGFAEFGRHHLAHQLRRLPPNTDQEAFVQYHLGLLSAPQPLLLCASDRLCV